MTSKPETARPVNPPPAIYRRGQSVHVHGRSTIGVVVDVVGQLVELAIWPQARLRVNASEIEPIGPTDACLRSLGARGDLDSMADAFASIVDGNARRCQPRARDGRCHWCGRVLEDASEYESADGFGGKAGA